MLASGMQLGPYEILGPLGAGGMGEVYRAKDSRLERDVAIKVLPSQFAQDVARLARFEREAKSVAALSHPNILAIHDYGTEQGLTFAVMELLEGETLRGRIANGPIPWRKSVEIAAAIADGLTAAHAKGIIHRDLKPENIFLTENDWVKVLDFGLARFEPPASAPGDTPTVSFYAAATEAGAILGTVGYMSPEQVRAQRVDARSDVFSLGCVLFEMVEGERAFTGESVMDTLAAILHNDPLELVDSGKNVPLELSRLVKRCLEKRPDARCQSAPDVALALRAILSDSSFSMSNAVIAGGVRMSVMFWLLTACVLLGMATMAAFLIVPSFRNGQAGSQTSMTGLAFSSLAILPLDNVTGDSQGEPLCEGLAEHLSGRLSQVHELKVRPITSTVHYRGQSANAKTVGRELDVHAVVSGRLRQEGETLVISLELVDARDNSLVWSNQYKGNRQQILDLQDQLARDLAGQLGLKLTGDEEQRLTRRYTADPEAYLFYREAIFHLNKFTPEGLATAIEYCQRAIKKDPKYALAHAALARCHILQGTTYRGLRETFPEARKHVDLALKIDGSLPEAHTAGGVIYLFYEWNWPAAEREFKQALASDANVVSTRNMYGFWLAAMDRLPEALASIRLGQELDPLAAPRSNEVAMCYNWMRKYDQAMNEARQTLKMDPNFFLAYRELGLALTQSGRFEEAIAELHKGLNVSKRHTRILGQLGYAYAMAGQESAAQEVLEELKESAELRFGSSFALAQTYAALGELDDAFQWLQKACDERDSMVIWIKVHSNFDNLRSDPRFDVILQEMNLE